MAAVAVIVVGVWLAGVLTASAAISVAPVCHRWHMEWLEERYKQPNIRN